MQYRKFGRLDFEVSALGFGAMRLPMEKGKVDDSEAVRIIRHAIDNGVNYVDTAFPYHEGYSEVLVGKALKNGYRQKTSVATKLPSWNIHAPSDLDKYFEIQLERLQLERIDFYLLHALNTGYWDTMLRVKALEWAEKKIHEGQIGHIGFSFHDDYPGFERIITGYDWDFCQIQYNYMDTENQAGKKGLKLAAERGTAVVVMEPILGGRLVDPPDRVRAIWDGAAKRRTPADWALQWLWDQPEVSLVLSGMSNMKQTQENLASADVSGIGSFTAADHETIGKVTETYKSLAVIPCTQCQYCQPCPHGVNIPRNFENYNMGLMYEKPESAREGYMRWTPEDQQARNCIQCGECLEKCPQKIPISDWMPVIHEVLGENKPYRESL
ncbi:MAG: aldo/keto reductase [Spirochaetales bacterium]|nr:aldo/keto reductase [Spirochaetales bacterium]